MGCWYLDDSPSGIDCSLASHLTRLNDLHCSISLAIPQPKSDTDQTQERYRPDLSTVRSRILAAAFFDSRLCLRWLLCRVSPCFQRLEFPYSVNFPFV